MAETGTLHDAFIDELRDSYDAERQLTKALAKLAKAATSPQLREAFETHLEETQGHVERLERVFETLEEKARGKHCDGIAGIIKEGKSVMEEGFDGMTMDACLIAAGQRAEHYEMAAYGTLVAWAPAMGHTEAAALLQETLDEEKAADQKLSSLAEGGINQDAAKGADPETDAEESEPVGAGASGKGRSPRGTAIGSPRSRRLRTRLVTQPVCSVPASGTALLLIDVINGLDFEGSQALVAQAEPMALRLAALKRRATASRVPCIHINDNFGRWRSDFRQTVTHCTARSSPGHRVSRRMRPNSARLLRAKPKHSGFFDTTLDTLLETLRVRRVILVGIAGNICILFTANDACMRDLKLFVPADCIVSNTPADNDHALRQLQGVLKATVAVSTALIFRKRDRGPKGGRS